MNTNKHIKSLLLSSLFLVATAGSALAGRGGGYYSILGAVQNGSEDAIIAKLEQAEKLPCSTNCLDLVNSLLSDERYRVREAAAWWFGKRPGHMEVLLTEGLATLTTTTDSVEARNTADMLGTFQRPVALPVLSAAINRTDLSADARAHIARALGTIGHMAANPALEVALADSSPAVRLEAVTAWGAIRHQDGAAPVAALVTDSDLTVQRAAISIVGKFATASARTDLEGVLASSTDAAVRRNAAWALGEIGDAASRAALTAATDDASSLVRMSAKAAIRNLR